MNKPIKISLSLQEQDEGEGEIGLNIFIESGKVWISIDEHGEATSKEGGYPIGIEFFEGEVNLLVWDDINKQDARVITMRKARQNYRV